jgi:hypothetical protein
MALASGWRAPRSLADFDAAPIFRPNFVKSLPPPKSCLPPGDSSVTAHQFADTSPLCSYIGERRHDVQIQTWRLPWAQPTNVTDAADLAARDVARPSAGLPEPPMAALR